MPELARMEKQFFDTLAALGEGLEKLVVVGGWCPFLYAGYLWHRHLPQIPTTLDIDLGVMETGAARYPETVYENLKKRGYLVERLYPQEPEPIEFISKLGKRELKLEFITSFLTSDDTLNRFLGKQLACNRIEAFEILLQQPLTLLVPRGTKNLTVHLPAPATYLFHKGISFVMRGEKYKLEKDLFYLYFILKYSPDQEQLVRAVAAFSGHELFPNFRENLRAYLGGLDQPGYAILRKFLKETSDRRTVNKEIQEALAPLMAVL